jgi:hypothetical protein
VLSSCAGDISKALSILGISNPADLQKVDAAKIQAFTSDPANKPSGACCKAACEGNRQNCNCYPAVQEQIKAIVGGDLGPYNQRACAWLLATPLPLPVLQPAACCTPPPSRPQQKPSPLPRAGRRSAAPAAARCAVLSIVSGSCGFSPITGGTCPADLATITAPACS